jgi:hypothetical protein
MNGRRAAGRLRPDMQRALALALLWAIGVAAFELSGLPWNQFDTLSLLHFGIDIMSCWFVVGLAVVAYATWAGRLGSTALVVAGHLLVVAPASALFYAAVMRSGLARYVADFEVTSSYGYLLWSASFYGALFIVWWCAAERGEATRRLLADARIARRRSEAELGRARLLALRGQVDPALLCDVMMQVQQRYRDDPDAGDRLLDLLVAFLRCAMPAVRSGTSTLVAEVALVRAWSALSRERDPRRPAWQVDAPDVLPELAFPPLLLLPVLEQLGRGAAFGATPLLHIRAEPGRVTLVCRAGGAAPALEPALAFRLRVGLQTVHGERWTLVLRDAGAAPGAALTLTLPTSQPSAAAAIRPETTLTHDPPGETPWTMHPATTTT